MIVSIRTIVMMCGERRRTMYGDVFHLVQQVSGLIAIGAPLNQKVRKYPLFFNRKTICGKKRSMKHDKSLNLLGNHVRFQPYSQ